MGMLSHFNFTNLADRFPHFLETGTGRCASLTYAANHPFRSLRSVDIDMTMHERAKRLFETEPRVTLYHGHTLDVLQDMLREIPLDEPIVYWLDAHNPGCFYGWPAATFEMDIRLPLEKELQLILVARRGAPRDLFLIDDLRIYLQDSWGHGNLPSAIHTLEPEQRNIDFVGMFAETHDVRIDHADDGYLILSPRGDTTWLGKPLIRELVDTARCLVETGSSPQAAPLYERVLELTDPPENGVDRIARGEAAHYKAMEALRANRNGTAIDWFQEAISADPKCVEYRHDLVLRGLMPMGWHTFAEGEARRTVGLFPEDPTAWRTQLNVQKELGHEAEARAACTALRGLSDDEESLRAAAAFEMECGNHEDAIEIYRRLLATNTKRRAEFIHDIAICTDRQGRHEEALELFDEVVALGDLPDQALLHWNRGWTLLTLGRYEEGWKEVQAREGLKDVLPGLGAIARRFRRPQWHLEAPPSRVHVHGEQGFGDVLALARWVPLIRNYGHDVRLEVAAPLVELFRGSFAGVTVVERSVDYPGTLGLADFDYHIPMMALPLAFGCTLDNIPPAPYLSAAPADILCKRDSNGGRKRIGLCWESGVRNGIWFKEYAARKSVPAKFREILLRRDISERVTWWMPDFEKFPMTFAESAAQLAALDLLITADTALAHLAGAMGVPTWLMMHVNGSWHWMAGGRDERWERRSPWYPSVTIYRQKQPHEWGDQLNEIAVNLIDLLKGSEHGDNPGHHAE